MIEQREIRHAHFFCGLGGGARGFNRGQARVGNMEARFRCIGGIDVDPASIADFDKLAGVKGTVLDLFSREQYTAFHGREPGPDWREAGIEDVQRAFGGERPHIVFLSAPCKGFSGLLAEKQSKTDKYQALNELTLRGVWLMLEAYRDDLPELIIFENVPRIATRGRGLLDQIVALLRHYGFATAETTHDCGELGGLAQSRKRFLLVARHAAKVPPYLYEPAKRRLRGVGEVLDRLPLPGDPRAGVMHRVPALQWQTWVRLAFVEAGADWRSLNKLAVEDGMLRDFGILPETDWRSGVLGVSRWDEPTGVVAGRSGPSNGNFAVADPRAEQWASGQSGVRRWDEPTGVVTGARSPLQNGHSVADPRIDGHEKSVQLGVRPWDRAAPTIKGDVSVGGGPYAVSDPRIGQDGPRFSNVYRIVPWGDQAPAVTSARGALAAVADPRGTEAQHVNGKYRVTGYDEPAGSVIAASTTGNGACAVQDPRCTWGPDSHRNKLKVVGYGDKAPTVTGSDRVGSGACSVADPRPVALNSADRAVKHNDHYGVVAWDEASKAVIGSADKDNGRWSVADPRDLGEGEARALPAAKDRLVAVIRARDGTWHRPFTTLELAALQSLVDPEEVAAGQFLLDGKSDSDWRERIGNAVPSDAAQQIASMMGQTLLLAWSGETFMLSSSPIWVQPLAIALSVDSAEQFLIADGFDK